MYIRYFLAALLIISATVFSQTTETEFDRKPLTLGNALELALGNNPSLAAMDFEVEASRAETQQAGLFSNPELSLEIENIRGDGVFEGYSSRERTLMLSTTYGMGGKRRKEKKVALSNEKLSIWQFEDMKLKTASRIKAAFYETLGAQKLLALNEDILLLAEEMYSAVNARVEAGKVSPVEKIKAKSVLLNQELELAKAERDNRAATEELFPLLGISTQEFAALEGDLENSIDLSEKEHYLVLLENNPLLKSVEERINLKNADIALQKSERFPDVEIGAGYRDVNDTGEHSWSVEFSFPVKIFNRNQGNIRAAEYRLAGAEEEKKSVLLELEKELSRIYYSAETLQLEAVTLRDEIVPCAEKVYESAVEGYRLGKFDYLEVLDAQRLFFESQRKYIQALVSCHKAVAELEYLISQIPNNTKGDIH